MLFLQHFVTVLSEWYWLKPGKSMERFREWVLVLLSWRGERIKGGGHAWGQIILKLPACSMPPDLDQKVNETC